MSNISSQRDRHLCLAIDKAVRQDAAKGRLKPLDQYIRRVLDTGQPPFYYVEPDQAMRMMRLIDSRPGEWTRPGKSNRQQWLEIYTRFKERLRLKGITSPRQWRAQLHIVLLMRPSRYFVSYDRARRIYNRYTAQLCP